MISQKVLRSYLLIAGLGIAISLPLKPAQETAPDSNPSTDWSLPEFPNKPFGANSAADISALPWWVAQGGTLAVDDGSTTSAVAKRTVTWRFNGVVSAADKRFALVAEDAESQPKRYLPGDALPGGERLELIDAQGIRFSLPDEGGDQERKLYVPAE